MPDWWNKLSHVLVLISWGRWNWNSMRKKIWLPGHVRSRKRDDVMWHKCYLHRNWTQISKIYHWELRMVLLNRPHLLQQKTQNKVFGKVFSKQRAGRCFCSTNLCLYIWCNSDRFSCTRIRLFEILKKSRLVTWHLYIRVFIQTPSGIQKDTLWICVNRKKISKSTIKIDSIMQPIKTAIP